MYYRRFRSKMSLMRTCDFALRYALVVATSLSIIGTTLFAQGGFTGPGWYRITNLKSGRSLALAPDMRAVVQLSPRDSEDQAWLIDPAPGGMFFIRNGVNGNALQPTSGDRSAQVVAAPYNGQPGQQWRIQPGKDGNALIANSFGRVLDIANGEQRDGVPLQIYDNNGDSNQRFTLSAVRGEYGNRWRRPPEQVRTLTCSSDDGRRHYCDVDPRASVRMTRQVSGSPCREGQTWGKDDHGLWVDRGCRAQFEVSAGGRPDRDHHL